MTSGYVCPDWILAHSRPADVSLISLPAGLLVVIWFKLGQHFVSTACCATISPNLETGEFPVVLRKQLYNVPFPFLSGSTDIYSPLLQLVSLNFASFFSSNSTKDVFLLQHNKNTTVWIREKWSELKVKKPKLCDYMCCWVCACVFITSQDLKGSSSIVNTRSFCVAKIVHYRLS